jgi:chaperonin GroEL
MHLRQAHARAEQADIRTRLGERIGKLQGGSAVLWVGGLGPADIAERRERANRTLSALRATIGRGVVPGGGAALLACAWQLRARAVDADDPDEAAAQRMLARALEEPRRVIIHNAGYDPVPLVHAIARAGAGHGFDVRTGQVVDLRVAGIIDPLGVVHAALHSAIASAALALTVDVLVHQRLPELSFEP